MDEKTRNMIIQAVVIIAAVVGTYIYATMGK